VLAACVTNANNTSGEISCDLGASVSWIGGDSVDVVVPVIAGSSAAEGLVNRATINATLQGRPVTLDDTATVDVILPRLKVNKVGPGVSVPANTSFPWTITAGATAGVVTPLIVVDELPNTDIKFVTPIPTSKWLRKVGTTDQVGSSVHVHVYVGICVTHVLQQTPCDLVGGSCLVCSAACDKSRLR
jgi:hypothetical protein